jgi:hypothetical protein
MRRFTAAKTTDRDLRPSAGEVVPRRGSLRATVLVAVINEWL